MIQRQIFQEIQTVTFKQIRIYTSRVLTGANIVINRHLMFNEFFSFVELIPYDRVYSELIKHTRINHFRKHVIFKLFTVIVTAAYIDMRAAGRKRNGLVFVFNVTHNHIAIIFFHCINHMFVHMRVNPIVTVNIACIFADRNGKPCFSCTDNAAVFFMNNSYTTVFFCGGVTYFNAVVR